MRHFDEDSLEIMIWLGAFVKIIVVFVEVDYKLQQLVVVMKKMVVE